MCKQLHVISSSRSSLYVPNIPDLTKKMQRCICIKCTTWPKIKVTASLVAFCNDIRSRCDWLLEENIKLLKQTKILFLNSNGLFLPVRLDVLLCGPMWVSVTFPNFIHFWCFKEWHHCFGLWMDIGVECTDSRTYYLIYHHGHKT